MYRFVMFILLCSGSAALLPAQSKTLYAVSRATSTYRIGQSEFPCIGLFSSNDNGKSWEHHGWYYSKCFSVSVVEADQDLRLFYLSCGNGILKSPDNGKTWKIATGSDMTECLKTAIHPDDPDIVYAATAYGIFKSKDRGNTWTEKNRGLTSTFTPDVVIDRDDPEILYCATESGIHKSSNSGELWQPVALLGKGIRTIVQHDTHSGLMAVGTENDGVFISTDQGKTWTNRIKGMNALTVYAVALVPQDRNTLYAGTYNGGIYKSIDQGLTWQPVNQGLKSKGIHSLAVNPNDQNNVFAGTLGDGVWQSQNGGASWQFSGLESSEIWHMIFK